jgi:NAD(P)H-nitrite reductase large subunit
MHLDDEICLCFHVSKRKIVNFLRVEQPRRVSQVSECFGAGTGCGWCRPFLQRYFDEMRAAGELAADDVTKEEYASGRSQYVREGRGTPPPGATPIDPVGERPASAG